MAKNFSDCVYCIRFYTHTHTYLLDLFQIITSNPLDSTDFLKHKQ